MDKLLNEIRDFADAAHGDQMRKYEPARYIVHPVRVMELCRKYTDDITILAAALLHDVLEDTPVTREEISEFLSQRMDRIQVKRTLGLVEELTDVYVKKAYPQWNRNKRKAMETERMSAISEDAQTIKYADIIDNSVEITKHDRQFAGRFLHECRNILRHMNKGNKILYTEALQTVNEGLRLLHSAA